MKSIKFYFIIVLLFVTMCKVVEEEQIPEEELETEINVSLSSKVDSVQPFTGLVVWEDSSYAATDAIQLEFSYMLYNDIVSSKGEYNWTKVERVLNKIAANGHQAILRFRFTYPGYKTSVPDYIKNNKGYNETKAKSEGLTTYFPDWSFKELEDFTLEFYTKFADKYDDDPRLAYLQTGFGLWAEYHIYDGPMELGRTFPSKEFQKKFFEHLDEKFKKLYWSVSIDAAIEERTPLKANPSILDIDFGLFDDSFLNKEHDGYNRNCFDFFDIERYKKAPMGGELSYYTDYDQEHALDVNGPHGISFEAMSETYHISYMIGSDQPNYQPMSRIKEAGMNIGYKFRIKSFKATSVYSKIIVENYGIAPLYYDAYITINGIRADESLKLLLPGEEKEYEIKSGGDTPKLTIECDKLVSGQTIQFDANL